MRIFKKGPEVERSFEELAEDYCNLSVISGEVKKLTEAARPELLKGFDDRDVKVVSGTGWTLERRISNKKAVKVEELEKVCKKKGVDIGSVMHTIRPKTNAPVPADILKSLDAYFVLETHLEVSEKDVQKAVDTGLITQKDYDKIIEINPSSSLYPKVEDSVVGKIIKD